MCIHIPRDDSNKNVNVIDSLHRAQNIATLEVFLIFFFSYGTIFAYNRVED